MTTLEKIIGTLASPDQCGHPRSLPGGKSLATLAVLLGSLGAVLGMAAPAHADTNFVGCAATFYNAEYPQSGVGTGSPTSCPFAENVRYNYVIRPTRGVVVTIPAYSPVTGQVYYMTCFPGTAFLVDGTSHVSVECRGGNDAVVVLF